MILKPADIVCTKGRGKLAKVIRFFTRKIGEPRSQVNHVGVIVIGGTLDKAIIVEALQRVVRRPILEGYGGKSPSDVAIFRPLNLGVEDRWKIATVASEFPGKRYGYAKILLHLADWALQGAYVFRRLGRMTSYPICSWLVAEAFSRGAGKTFGVDPGAATPDDIWDFCLANPDKYELVCPLQPLRKGIK